MKRSTIIAGCVLFAGTLMPSTASADGRTDVLIRESFDSVATGDLPHSGIQRWLGTMDEHMGDISAQPMPDGTGKSLEITNFAHNANRAPCAIFRWLKQPAEQAVLIEYRFMIPVEGPYLSICFLGGDWKTAAAILMAGNGKLMVQYGEHDARIEIGTYEPHHWYTVRYEIDPAARTATVYLDGKKRLNKLPWQQGAVAVGGANVYADLNLNDHHGEPVLYIDDVTVKAIASAR